MTRSPLWREFENGEGILLLLLRWCVLIGGLLFLCVSGTFDLTWPQQLFFAGLTIAVAIWMDRSSTSYLVTLTLLLLSLYSTFRYGFWRVNTTYHFFNDPAVHWTVLDAFFMILLLLAECYAFVVLFLGYLQMLWPLRRIPVPLPEDPDNWPAVDLLIPTYNEPLSVVRFTALAAMNIDWPADKLNVYLLDDGKREEFRAFAEEAGIGYMTRDDNRHAKAGNINAALSRLDSPFVAIFDSDHVPTRSFLQVTMGWFLRDRKLGMLQTPHHFYSPDPFERNLDQFRIIPNEGELFYGIVQDGNDFWNATFFCGSCAVMRRTALDEIGGIAVETVTEDAHTSLRMQMNEWNTAYINIPQAAGLATERLSGHVKQRIRWARGMVQILRIENPLFAPGLAAAQRLCYFNAMSHFLYALPRLIFLTAPLIYLIFSHTNIPGFWAAILAYALPHLVLSNLTNSRIQGQHRHSFWNEIYETVLAPYIFLPTMFALISPKLGNFNVTAKGGVVNRSFFDARIALPFLVLLFFDLVGMLCAIPRFFQIPYVHVAGQGWLYDGINWALNIFARMYDGTHPGTIWMNLIWTVFNVIILGVATAVAWETQQRRQTVRVAMSVASDVILPGGQVIRATTSDLSSGGVRTRLDQIGRGVTARVGDPIKFVFPVLDGTATLPATIISLNGSDLRAQFDPLTLQEEEALTMILYSRADTWLGWGEAREPDSPIRSMGRILRLSFHGLSQTLRGLMSRNEEPPRGKYATNAAPLLLLVLMLGTMFGAAPRARAAMVSGQASTQPASQNNAPVVYDVPGAMPAKVAKRTAAAVAPAAPASTAPTGQLRSAVGGTFDNTFKLSDIGVPDTIVLRGVDSYHSVYFSLPQNQIVKTATMKIRYHFSPGLIPALSHIKVSLNGTLFATLAVTDPSNYRPGVTGDLTPEQKVAAANKLTVTRVGEHNALLEATLTLPVESLVRNNELTFEFVGHYTLQCEDPSHSTLWSHVDSDSTIELAGSLLQLQDDLKLLPLPFYDKAVNLHPVIPVVFLTAPSPQAMRAAGILTSWLGMLTNDHPARFPVYIGSMPAGNVIVISEVASQIPDLLGVKNISGPTIAMRTNPADPYGKVLVVTGDDGDELVQAAMGLALAPGQLQGPQARIASLSKPAFRQPDDAPRWLSTDHITPIGDISQTGDLQGDGSVPVGVYLRVPPDLYYGTAANQQNLAFHMNYRYNPTPLANESTLQVYMNSAYVSSTPMPHTEKSSEALSTVVPVPIFDMRPFSNSMMLKFVFQIAKKGECQDTAPMNLQGVIAKDSYLDITGIPHWAKMPNLEIFANAGYPFTRRADLSDTVVVLPDAPTPDELELYLTLMGHFGAQTGYPALYVGVTNAAGMTSGADKDYLILGTVDDQPAIGKLNSSLPVGIDRGGLHVHDTGGFFGKLGNAWWRNNSSEHVKTGELETSGGLPDAVIEGMEWPKNSGHSVVLVALRDHQAQPAFLDSFLKNAQSSDIGQSVSVLRGGDFSAYRVGDEVYHVGSLSWLLRLSMLFAENPFIVAIIIVVICILMAALIRARLRRHARGRLQGDY
jgi:cellulose synthase (UDP-forming)